MAGRKLLGLAGVAAIVAVLAPAALALAQGGTQALASVELPRRVMADGKLLSAGTYSVRVSSETVRPVVGQSAEGARWVEFVQSGQVRGRELASVMTAAAAKEISESGLPASGTARVELLKGNEYVRVWINSGGTHYLIHLLVPSGE